MSQAPYLTQKLSDQDSFWSSACISWSELDKENFSGYLFGLPVYKNIHGLQLKQYYHDRNYHWDIQVLSVSQRLNHFALHFSKYIGRLIEASLSNDIKLYQQAITDFFIISLAAANTLNLSLADSIQKEIISTDSDFTKISSALSLKYHLKLEDPHFIINAMALYTGRMAKACESVDHLENYPFKEVISKCVTHISIQVIITASLAGIDLVTATQERLGPVKERFIFHSDIRET